MKLQLAFAAAVVAGALGCAQQSQRAATTIPHSSDSIAATGEGQKVAIRGRSVDLAGTSLRVGDRLPSMSLVKSDMQTIDLSTAAGKVRVRNIVPPLDTATCEEQTHELSETNEGLDKAVELVTISMDLPFAQRRFAKEAKIENVTFLSDYRGQSFGKSTGLLQKQSQLLARAVLVVDKNNVIRHMQVVPDMATLPDMKTAFKVARSLL